jgi:rod shape-determining protein MreD
MRAVRIAAVAALIVVTITLQLSVFDHFALDGVAPDFALIVVVAAALVRGPEYAAAVGFAAGLVLDLAPPADHTAGRWALSFVGTSVFALTGLVLGDPGVTVTSVFDVVPRAVGYDVLIAPLALPLMLAALRRVQPAERW